MADPNINKTPEEMKNETMQREQGQPGFDKDREPETGGADKEREEKSAIGGGQAGQQGGQGTTAQTGQDQTGQSGQQFDKSRSEPTSR